jgi:hypothetical protein
MRQERKRRKAEAVNLNQLVAFVLAETVGKKAA